MDTDLDRARQDALAFLKHRNTGVLATSEREFQIHASAVHYTCDDEFNVYILTLANSRKFKALSAHPQVAFTIFAPDMPQTLQMEGMAMDISLDEEAGKEKDRLFAVLDKNQWFQAPITKLDPAEMVVVWIRPTWVRWADYAFEASGNKNIFKEISIIG